ncbi:MAG TPA: TetR/AcrR family transcriptional regulator [Rhodopila sp.]|uniref:TetR/AcrR family transcriptional regulator n=1 Tax=Rhodopila sp. TaxID=2480087 RepID=UPI002C94913A|nr:TetR/AcrR family transcriptional regulator [Rhodopila sp.]HVY17118.1 TetR/AcrR family transcriptional regulator [Rhodopila sp.]
MARTRATDFDMKRRAILSSAARVFAEQGMDKASMSQIADRADVSKSLLYHYYASKDALVFGIIHGHLTELDAALEAADDQGSEAPVRLRALIHTVLEAYRDADSEHKVQLNGASALKPEQQADIHTLERRIVERFARVLGEINPDLATGSRKLLKPMTMSLFGMLNWVYLWFREDGPVSRRDYADAATVLFLRGVGGVTSITNSSSSL